VVRIIILKHKNDDCPGFGIVVTRKTSIDSASGIKFFVQSPWNEYNNASINNTRIASKTLFQDNLYRMAGDLINVRHSLFKN